MEVHSFVVSASFVWSNVAKRPCYGPFKLTPSYYINLIGVISLFVSYWPPPTTMDAVSATIITGGWARVRLNIEVSRNKLISTLIYGIYLFASTAALEQTCSRPPTPHAAWVYQIHAAGGTSGSTTMVMVLGRWFVLFVWFLTRDSSVGHVLHSTF